MVLSSLNNYETVAMPELLAGLTGRTGDIILGFREKTSQSTKTITKSVGRQPQPAFEEENVEGKT